MSNKKKLMYRRTWYSQEFEILIVSQEEYYQHNT